MNVNSPVNLHLCIGNVNHLVVRFCKGKTFFKRM